MFLGEISTPDFESNGERAYLVSAWQKRYYALVKGLGQCGTEVASTVHYANDQDLAPHAFVRAEHMFVFPPQAEVRFDKTVESRGAPGYEERTEVVETPYNSSLVNAAIYVSYTDIDHRVSLSIEDMREGSAVPQEVTDIVRTILSPVEARYKSRLGDHLRDVRCRFPGIDDHVDALIENGVEVAGRIAEGDTFYSRDFLEGQLDIIAAQILLLTKQERASRQLVAADWEILFLEEAKQRALFKPAT